MTKNDELRTFSSNNSKFIFIIIEYNQLIIYYFNKKVLDGDNVFFPFNLNVTRFKIFNFFGLIGSIKKDYRTLEKKKKTESTGLKKNLKQIQKANRFSHIASIAH